MIAPVLVDTNILVYAAHSGPTEKRKHNRALEILSRQDFGLSAQSLAEFYVCVTRPGRSPMRPDIALEWIEQFEKRPCVAIDALIVKRGAEISVTNRVSYWDGAIIAAAEALGATTLLTEDLNHSQRIGTVEIVNPFI